MDLNKGGHNNYNSNNNQCSNSNHNYNSNHSNDNNPSSSHNHGDGSRQSHCYQWGSTIKTYVSNGNSSADEVCNLKYNTSSSSVSPASVKSQGEIIEISSTSDSRLNSSLYSDYTHKKKRRKRPLQKDDDIDSQPPSPKRQQLASSLYQSDSESTTSSVIPSPDGELVHLIETQSSPSACDVVDAGIPESSDSPDSANNLKDFLQDANVYDDNVYISTSSSSSGSDSFHLNLNAIPSNGERTPGQEQSTERPTKTYSLYPHCLTPAAEPVTQRECPLPPLAWADSYKVWTSMCKKDELAKYLRSPDMLEQHPGLQPRMRAILLDWLIEVCEVYKLHRETYYLAVDYLDRYLTALQRVQKTHLQLIGITCLFVASKVEEIYPPKIGEFAYVTDGACQESDILKHEVLLLQALKWRVSPITPIGWLGIYMQLNVSNCTPVPSRKPLTAHKETSDRYGKEVKQFKNFHKGNEGSDANVGSDKNSKKDLIEVDRAFIYPQFSGMQFVKTTQLLDLCSLDVNVGSFPYSVLAAAAMSYTFDKETAVRCSGFDWETIIDCVIWMAPFVRVILEQHNVLELLEQNEQVPSKYGMGHVCPAIVTDESYIIQTHNISMKMFDEVCVLHEHTMLKLKDNASPATGLICPEGLLTPPASSRKPLDSGANDEAAEEVPADDDDDDDNNPTIHPHPRTTNNQNSNGVVTAQSNNKNKNSSI